MATHSSILAWEIPWPEEPDGLLLAWALGPIPGRWVGGDGHSPSGNSHAQATLVYAEGQGNLACCSSWGRKESDMTEKGY